MKRVKRQTKRERKELNPGSSGRIAHQHAHCIACGRHIDPSEFNSSPPDALTLTCEHEHSFSCCSSCQVMARTLIAEHERTGKPVQIVAAWH